MTWAAALLLLFAGSSAAEDSRPLVDQGLMAYEEGRFAEAEKYLKQAVGLNPKSFSIRFALAASLLRQEKGEQALPELQAANQLKPDHLDAAKLLAIEYSKRRRNRDAALILRPLMRTAPNDEELHLLLIEAYHHSAAAVESLAVAQESLKTFPESARLLYWVGRQSGQQEHLRKAIAIDPLYAPAYHSLADILIRENKSVEAEKMLRKTLANQADDVQALIRLGRLTGDIGLLRKAAGLAPNYSLVHLELSRLYAKRGDKENAHKEAERFRQIRNAGTDTDLNSIPEK